MSDPGLVCGIARLMKSHTVVAYGTRLIGSFTRFAFPSGVGERDPPGPPAASAPGQQPRLCLKGAGGCVCGTPVCVAGAGGARETGLYRGLRPPRDGSRTSA